MNIEKIKQIAHEKYGRELTDEQATQYAEKYGKLDDNELDNISGGCNGVGDGGRTCEACGSEMVGTPRTNGQVSYSCPNCG